MDEPKTVARHRGGARVGAGRKRDPDAPDIAAGPLRRCQVMLDAQAITHLTTLGDGNLSLGIRRAAQTIAASGVVQERQRFFKR